MHTLWKNEQFTLTRIFFRQINSLVIYLVNALLSRNFCQKSVRVNFRNFHIVLCKHNCNVTTVWKLENFPPTILSQNSHFHEIFAKKLRQNFRVEDTVWKLQKFTLTLFGKNFVKATHLLNKSLKT